MLATSHAPSHRDIEACHEHMHTADGIPLAQYISRDSVFEGGDEILCAQSQNTLSVFILLPAYLRPIGAALRPISVTAGAFASQYGLLSTL